MLCAGDVVVEEWASSAGATFDMAPSRRETSDHHEKLDANNSSSLVARGCLGELAKRRGASGVVREHPRQACVRCANSARAGACAAHPLNY